MDEEVEIEVLEPQDNWEKEYPVLAELITTQVPVQRIIINGEEQVVTSEACALICPKCRLIIQQFQPGIPEVEILKALCTDNEEALNRTLYCQKCGQKLKVMRPMPVEGDYEIIESVE